MIGFMSLSSQQKQALQALYNLTGSETAVYLVGGWVRDTLLAKPSDDIDAILTTTPQNALEISRRFANKMNAKPDWQVDYFVLHPETGTSRIIFKPENAPLFYFDVMAMEGTDLDTDAHRRDFTVNALIVPLEALANANFEFSQNIVLDKVGGLDDLNSRIIRPISEANIIADPLRILRGIRLRASLSSTPSPVVGELVTGWGEGENPINSSNPSPLASGGQGSGVGGVTNYELRVTNQEKEALIHPTSLIPHPSKGWDFAAGTLEMFRRHVALIDHTAAERIKVELDKTLLAGQAERSLRWLDEIGLLTRLIPELAEGKNCVQMTAHYYEVFEHNLVAVDRLEWLLRPANYNGTGVDILSQVARPETAVKHWGDITTRLFADGRERELNLLWATLLHDIGKPRTKAVAEDGKISFYNHNRVGAEMARKIMERLRAGNQQAGQVATMVLQHLRIGQLGEHFDPLTGEGITKKAIFRFLRDTEPVQAEMLPLSLADHAAVVGPELATARQLRSWLRHLVLTDLFARNLLGSDEERIIGKARLVDGNLLMQTLNLPPSQKIGVLLREIEEAQAIGQISTTEQALELARTLLDNL
jgi:putative nucleotidyltransferase with HDIG domain